MVRKLISRVFGFEREIEELKSRLHRAGYDESFGMLTRQGLENAIERLPRGDYQVVFIDLDDMHGLNAQIGYEAVNKRVRGTFNPDWNLRKSDIIGRWFSGDEIVLVLSTDHDGAQMIAESFLDEAHNNGLGFTYSISSWYSDMDTIDNIVADLSRQVMSQKENKRSA